MKVLHIISGDLWAGAEVQTYSLLAHLNKTQDVQVAAALMNEGQLAYRLRNLGIPVTVLPESELNSWQLLHHLRRLIGQWRPDIVHTHRFKENILGSLANRLSTAAPSMRTAHGASEANAWGWRKWPQRMLDVVDRCCVTSLQQRIISVTAELATKLTAYYPAEKIVVIENGIDIEAVKAAGRSIPTISFDPAKTHIGIVGRLVAVKRVDLFLQTAAMLRQQHPGRQWEFHLFGDGPLRHPLMQQTQSLGLGGITRFHGHRDDVAACIAKLDVLIMCSDHEGMPMTLLEAMTLETPVVGHAVGGIDRLLQSGLCGWPVSNHAAAGYAQAVQAALYDPAAKATRARAAAANIEKNYSATLCAERHMALYSQLLSMPQVDASLA